MILIIKRIVSILITLISILAMSNGKEKGKFVTKADVSLIVNPLVEYQKISGFGASACWWAQEIGSTENADEVARLLFGKDGLGLNIYRYNIGGGEKENPSSRIRGNRATESFYFLNEATGEYEYDFTRDADAQHMLDLALSYGCVDTVVLFANSPHYSMTVTGQATGGTEEYFSNLPPENYEAFADYFITIAKYFIDKGVPVKYISPINEPQWSWGGGWVGQEGCHYEPDEIVALMKVFAKAIKESGLDVKLMAPESGEVGERTLDWFDRLVAEPDVADVLGSLAYHSYWSDSNAAQKYNFGNAVMKKNYGVSVDMTEWCELPLEHDIADFGGAMRTARVIAQDLELSNANSWSAWVGVNNYSAKEDGTKWSDGLLSMSDGGADFEICERYYAMAHYSKFIPAGSTRIRSAQDVRDVEFEKDDSGNYINGSRSFDVSAWKTPENKYVIVIVNEGKDRNFTITELGKFRSDVWQSTADSKLENIHSGIVLPLVKCPAQSITTIVLY